MATDVLISSLDLSVVGYLYTDCVVPVVGNNPYAQAGSKDTSQLTTSLEGDDIPQNRYYWSDDVLGIFCY